MATHRSTPCSSSTSSLREHDTSVGGRRDHRDLFDRLLAYASPAGIFSEEIGPEGRLIGDIPQAFTHLALVSAATHLDRALANR